jgi:small-conductance mechanosensitive channel
MRDETKIKILKITDKLIRFLGYFIGILFIILGIVFISQVSGGSFVGAPLIIVGIITIIMTRRLKPLQIEGEER